MARSVLVAMSGGVDSSVAAALLQDQGYAVVGATLKLIAHQAQDGAGRSQTCCSLDDVADARCVAGKLGFEHYVFNFGALFRQEVIRRFAESYSRGETPNPCIDCNRRVKFPKLLERARMLDIDCLATGHYAQVAFDGHTGRYQLRKARDPAKDQTYVLYALTQQELAHIRFPLGQLLKSEVRGLAEARGLVNARKPDSQDICFVPDGDYAGFLRQAAGVHSEPGLFIDRDGKMLGEHKGLVHYTVGQRRGLNLSFGRPQYVLEKDPKANTVTLGDESALYRAEMPVGDLNWIACAQPDEPLDVRVKIRYSAGDVPARLFPMPGDQVRVVFAQSQRAVTPGQAAVFYQGDQVVGGGTILPGA